MAEQEKKPEKRKLKHWLQRPSHTAFWLIAIMLITALSAFSFAPRFANQETNWHDEEILNNDTIQNLNIDNVDDLFLRSTLNVYRPLTILSYAIDYQKSDNLHYLRSFHLTQLLLHIACSIALLMVLMRSLNNRAACLAVALLFSCLSANTEAVVWLSARAESLSLLFMLLALFYFIRFLETESYRGKIATYSAAIILALAAMLSKEQAVILPLLLFWYHLCFRTQGGNRITGHLRKVLHKFHCHLPFFMMALVISYIHFVVRSHDSTASHNYPALLERMISTCHVMSKYLVSFFNPTLLSPDHMAPFDNRFSATTFIGLSFFLALPILTLASFSWNRTVSFSAGWFIICMFPFINLVPLTTTRADHYLYSGSIAFCIILVCCLTRLWDFVQGSKISRYIVVMVFILILSSYSFYTRSYTRIWQNSQTLWTHVQQQYPGHIRARHKLALYYLANSQKQMAHNELKTALHWDPNSPQSAQVAGELARLYTQEGMIKQSLDLADRYLPTVLLIEDNDLQHHCYADLFYTRAETHKSLLLFEQSYNDYQQAIKEAGKIKNKQLKHALLKIYTHALGVLSAELRYYNRSEEHFRECLDMDSANLYQPDNTMITEQLADLYTRMGKWDTAENLLIRAIKDYPQEHSLHHNLATMYLVRDNPEQAMQHYDKASALQADKPLLRLEFAQNLLLEGYEEHAISLIKMGLSANSSANYREQAEEFIKSLEPAKHD